MDVFANKDIQSPNTTVDQADVQLHTKATNEWWDLNGPMKGLHSYNLKRVPFIQDGLAEEPSNAKTLTPLKAKTILDVGCGGGILSVPLAKLGAKVTGIDASPELIDIATFYTATIPELKDNMPKFIFTPIEDHAESNKELYDAVVASEIIEHVTNKELFVRSCVNVLKPGGRIFFTTPNRTLLSHITNIVIGENIVRSLPKGTHQIHKFVTPSELTRLLESNNCRVEKTHGIFYNALTNSWYNLKCQKFFFALQAIKNK